MTSGLPIARTCTNVSSNHCSRPALSLLLLGVRRILLHMQSLFVPNTHNLNNLTDSTQLFRVGKVMWMNPSISDDDSRDLSTYRQLYASFRR